MIKYAVLFFLIIFLFIEILSAYVTEDGKEVPPLPPLTGSETTISSAGELAIKFSSLIPGETIVIAPGTYLMSGREPFPIDEDNITIRGATGDPGDVVIVGRGFESCGDVDEEMFMLYANNFTIADLTISESRCHGIKFQGGNNDHTIIHNVKFLNIGERMIKAPGTTDATACSIRYCQFEDTKIPSSSRCGQHDNGDYIAGMDLMKADSWVIHDNYFRNIRGANGGGRGGIFAWNGCRNMIAERNTFTGCDRSICYGNPSGSNDMDGGIIRNNFIYKGVYIGIEIDWSNDIKIYNNTVYSEDPDYSRTIFFYQNRSGNEFKNNIVFGRFNHNSGTMPDTANNLWQSSAFTNWFESVYTRDLHLTQNATPVIDQGLDLSDVVRDWDGHVRSVTDNNCDIGADEYNSKAGIRTFKEERLTAEQGIISVSPNPFRTSLEIELLSHNAKGISQNAKIEIYNLAGKLLASNLCIMPYDFGAKARWHAQDHPAGIYLVKYVTGNTTNTARVILLR